MKSEEKQELEYRAGSAEEMEADHPPELTAEEEQKLRELIHEAWNDVASPNDRFGDFLSRAAKRILEAGWKSPEEIEAIVRETSLKTSITIGENLTGNLHEWVKENGYRQTVE